MAHDKKILIVEDEEINRAILNEMFYRSYDALEATNGKEALEQIEIHKESIAVILLDVVMPVMDGVQFMEEMHRRDWIKDIPIVLITAEVTEKLSIRSYEFGISDVISKPFNPYIVKLRVGNIIELTDYRKNLEKVVQEQTIELQEQAEKLRQSNSFFIEALNTAVEFRDNESGMHVQRIRDITRLFLYMISDKYPRYHFLREDADLLCDAAAMHDIGKIAIPDAILTKPGRLTAEEFEIMKTHSIKGCEILDKLNGIENEKLLGYCYDICRHHHERWDGKGYPDGLAGDNISIWAQIVSVADVYDALVSKRVYKDACSHERAAQMIMNGECGTFNPMLLECLEEMKDLLKQAYDSGALIMDKKESVHAVAPRIVNSRLEPQEDNASRLIRLLQDERMKYQMVAENSGDILFEYNAAEDKILFEEGFHQVFDQNIEILNASKVVVDSRFFSPESREVAKEINDFMVNPTQVLRRQARLRTADGQYAWFEIYLQALWEIIDNREVCKHIMGRLSNINDLKSEAVQWQEKALRDGLTGLYNSIGCRQKAEELLAKDSKVSRVCFFIDVDDFKEINDTFGHLAGDQFLKTVGSRIQNCFRCTDIVARIGGDEFVVVASDLPRHLISVRAEKLCSIFREAFVFDDASISISASIGISVYPIDAVNYEDLLEKADQALYKAKRLGKNRYAFYQILDSKAKE